MSPSIQSAGVWSLTPPTSTRRLGTPWRIGDKTSRSAIEGLSVADSKWMFCSLLFYVLAQAMTVPILAFGPWPMWPNLADFAVGALVVSFIFATRRGALLPNSHLQILRALLFLLAACFVSFLVSVLLANLTSVELGGGKRIVYGLHILGRLIEFILVFGLVSVIPLTSYRVRILSRLSAFVLTFVSLACIGTHFLIIRTSDFSFRLPQGRDAAGPWDNYRMNYHNDGLGSIGYNHHYVAAQIVLVLGLWLALNPRPWLPLFSCFLVLATAAIFFTGSRSVLGAELLLAGTLLLRRSRIAPLVLVIAVALALMVPKVVNPSPAPSQQTSAIVQRQETTFKFYDAQNLSGREDIWYGKFSEVLDQPAWWPVGRGLGSAVDTAFGTSAHMLVLQILIETGIVGLIVIGFLMAALLRELWKSGAHSRTFFWISIALLITSASYETFYPLPSMGHFLGFYLCIVAICLRLDLASSRQPALQPARSFTRAELFSDGLSPAFPQVASSKA